MFCRKKVRVVLLLVASLLLVGILHTAKWRSLRAFLGFSVTCRESDAVVVSHLRRVQPSCASWPRQNTFYVAQGVLHRNRRLKTVDTRCYLLALDGATARVLNDDGTPVRSQLLHIECHDNQGHHERPHRLLLPAIPLPPLLVAQRGVELTWNVVVIGLGGLTYRLWTSAFPQANELVTKEMRGATVSRLAPMSSAPESDLLQLFRKGGNGQWITHQFEEKGYKTQAAVLTHADNQEPFSTAIPAAFNLSDYLEVRSSLHTPGCVGAVSEGSIALSWVREMMGLYATQHKVLSLLHLSDLIFPSTKRMDAELVSFLLEYLHFDCFSRAALILYSLPDSRSGFEPGVLVFHPPPRSADISNFRSDMLRSAFGVGDFFTLADINRVLAFIASEEKPSVLAPIGRDERSCANMRVESSVCKCQKLYR